jgi:hypothetical protein
MTLAEYTGRIVQVYVNKIESELAETLNYSTRHLDTLFKEYGTWVELNCAVIRLNTMIQRDIYDID